MINKNAKHERVIQTGSRWCRQQIDHGIGLMWLKPRTRVGHLRIRNKLKLVTYATADFKSAAEDLRSSALRAGFDSADIYGPDDLKTTGFYKQHQDILQQPRGGGYWLWKPYIIRKVLGTVRPDDIVFYCDAGRSSYYQFTRRPQRLEELVRANLQGFLLGPSVPHLGSLRQWTKRDCLILTGGDVDAVSSRPAIMTWSLWRPTAEAFDFLTRWGAFCSDPRCLTDLPNTLGDNYPDFIDHRHDQSILSIMAHKEKAPFLDFGNTWVQQAIKLRPDSSLAHHFYKRPENADTLLGSDNPVMLVREYLRIRHAT